MTPVKTITSADNPLLLRLRKLAVDPAGYRKQGIVWLAGDHLCSAFLARGGRPAQALITDEAWGHAELRTLAEHADAVTVLPAALM